MLSSVLQGQGAVWIWALIDQCAIKNAPTNLRLDNKRLQHGLGMKKRNMDLEIKLGGGSQVGNMRRRKKEGEGGRNEAG